MFEQNDTCIDLHRCFSKQARKILLKRKMGGGADLPKHKQKGTPTNFNNLQNPNFGGWEGQYIYIIYHDLVDL